jgi:hypothetical protein
LRVSAENGQARGVDELVGGGGGRAGFEGFRILMVPLIVSCVSPDYGGDGAPTLDSKNSEPKMRASHPKMRPPHRESVPLLDGFL